MPILYFCNYIFFLPPFFQMDTFRIALTLGTPTIACIVWASCPLDFSHASASASCIYLIIVYSYGRMEWSCAVERIDKNRGCWNRATVLSPLPSLPQKPLPLLPHHQLPLNILLLRAPALPVALILISISNTSRQRVHSCSLLRRLLGRAPGIVT